MPTNMETDVVVAGRDRDRSASDRDSMSSAHDVTADERDFLSDQRDARAHDREQALGQIDREAEGDRKAALRDRRAARGDRVNARDDRMAASSDRSLAFADRAEVLLDELTGCYRRPAGFLELEREIVRAELTEQQFVLVFIDVDGLKTVNDQDGLEAGDDLLREVARCTREGLRAYDVIIRQSGDQFVCGVPDLSIADVAERFQVANDELLISAGGSMSVGLAERAKGEGLASLIGRADAAMYGGRERRTSKGDRPGLQVTAEPTEE